MTVAHAQHSRLPRPPVAAPTRCLARYTHPGSPGAVVVASCAGGEIEMCGGLSGWPASSSACRSRLRTRFRIASVSKQFTVTAALMLAHEGFAHALRSPHKLPEGTCIAAAGHHRPDDAQLERPARLPRAAAAGRPRARQTRRAPPISSPPALNCHLNFAPGSRFLYSNTNFLPLGRIIEKSHEEEAR